jgi:DNA-binding Lrp family transcriptional regulator
MFTKPQDIVVALKLCLGATEQSYADMGKALGMSASEVHAAVRRLIEARLVTPDTKDVRREALCKFLVSGVPHAFPAHTGGITRGMPTAWAAPVMSNKFNAPDQIQPVWPDSEGKVRGESVRPLYSSVPRAARLDSALYDLLALVDALRVGRARERAFAEKEIKARLSPNVSS